MAPALGLREKSGIDESGAFPSRLSASRRERAVQPAFRTFSLERREVQNATQRHCQIWGTALGPAHISWRSRSPAMEKLGTLLTDEIMKRHGGRGHGLSQWIYLNGSSPHVRLRELDLDSVECLQITNRAKGFSIEDQPHVTSLS